MLKFIAATLVGALAFTGPAMAGNTARKQAPQTVGAYARKPMFVIEEYHLVMPGKKQEIIDYYRKWVMPVLRSYPGYMGWSILDPNPSATTFQDPSIAEFATLSDKPILPHEGVVLDGKTRTDRMINFHAGLKNSFNLIFHHYISDEATFRALIGHDTASANKQDSLAAKWKSMYGTNIWDVLARDYFVHMQNHYDVVYKYETVE